MEELKKEIERVEELYQMYKDIGPEGAFGSTMIAFALNRARKAENEEDIKASLEELKEITG